MFEFKKCAVEGLYEIQPKVFGDSRGYFFEAYSEKDFFEAGLTMKFVQDTRVCLQKMYSVACIFKSIIRRESLFVQ